MRTSRTDQLADALCSIVDNASDSDREALAAALAQLTPRAFTHGSPLQSKMLDAMRDAL